MTTEALPLLKNPVATRRLIVFACFLVAPLQ